MHPAPQEARNPVSYNQRLYRKRYRIENVFGRLCDWRGIASRCQRCGDILLYAVIFAAIVIV
ncbi:transposase [Paracoccus sp. SM22M-07]|uniref:transposase n=1 Tax=Paracoccus sp. SM22M-07 TaxID=1520813 RepID=UPI001114DCF4